MQAIILAGGFGTRLQSTLGGELPKPMAPLSGRPFLAWLLEYMEAQGIREAVLCVHHLHEKISGYFGDRFGDIRLHYSVETKPLGTGGAIREGLKALNPAEPVFALNGDSLVQVDYRRMMETHMSSGRDVTIASRRVEDCRRYSQLSIAGECVSHYELLGDNEPGDISTGFYIVSPNIFRDYFIVNSNAPSSGGFGESDPGFSFERDFLALHTPWLRPAVYKNVDYFIDIGVPEDYARAQIEIPSVIPSIAEGSVLA
jgi:D-glycero-alpha-D-manno-heptose 1-phosphate guanylyltransferase